MSGRSSRTPVFPATGSIGNRGRRNCASTQPKARYALRKGIVPIKPGNLDESEVWKRITSPHADSVMPPPESNKKLSAAQKETIRLWINQGARYQKHWSFEPITRPAVPAIRGAKADSPIDAFLLARLQQEGLAPTPQADRETQIRRVAFALTGLPPSVKELDAFLADKSPNAYEKLVDRYLASRRALARRWPATGSIWPATPTRTACTSTTNARCGSIATG